MRSYKLLLATFLAFGIFFSLDLSAQDEREDVVYLKNGNIYRGVIIEQVPGVSIKVETIGGNVFTVAISDILKTTREKKAEAPAPAAGPPHDGDMHGERYYRDHRDYHDRYHSRNDSFCKPQYHPRNRGYFNTAQLLIDNLEGGGRLVNGYKFSRLGYLGIGIGVDFVFNDLRRNDQAYSGVYLPLYLSYSGDILKKRITPYYSLEAGYAMRMNPNNNNKNGFPSQNFLSNNSGANSVRGGLMGGLGFGVKFHTHHRVFFSLSAQADFQQASNKYLDYYAPNGNYYQVYRTSTTLLIPGIRLGIGF